MRYAPAYLLTVVLAAGPAALVLRAQTQKPHPQPGQWLSLTATAYCHQGTTKSGARTKSGIAAADPLVLPVGSVVRVSARERSYAGIYTVMDTGPAVQGRAIDLFVRDCNAAQQFGRQPVRVRVLRRGWSPQASAPGER